MDWHVSCYLSGARCHHQLSPRRVVNCRQAPEGVLSSLAASRPVRYGSLRKPHWREGPQNAVSSPLEGHTIVDRSFLLAHCCVSIATLDLVPLAREGIYVGPPTAPTLMHFPSETRHPAIVDGEVIRSYLLLPGEVVLLLEPASGEPSHLGEGGTHRLRVLLEF